MPNNRSMNMSKLPADAPEFSSSEIRQQMYSGTRVAVIIDEFQDMKLYIHNVDEQELERIREKRYTHPFLEGTDLTATYDRQAQSRKPPMLVSGSAVTVVFRTVMGGPPGGRFDFMHLKPMSIPPPGT